MKFAKFMAIVACAQLVASVCSAESASDKAGTITPKTPSIPHYFSWINNTNEGTTEAQTLTNLRFFKWLHDDYGMQLKLYALDAGNLDTRGHYGSITSDRFKSQFPNGFSKIADLARSFDCELGIWMGPDGYGDTPEEEARRRELLVSLCRDYEFRLFKIDAVCGQLRDSKQDAFVETMKKCRQYKPDLIAINHRVNVDERGKRHMTTSLMGGRETYIDVHMTNNETAPHNRAAAISRRVPPDLMRLTEDHGVCLSSCLNFWQDDLILQAFNRSLILAPQLYGSPWLLSDEEYPKLARIFNLHFRNRDILVNGMTLPEEQYGPKAVSRGSESKRFVTLRNLSWEPVTYEIKLNEQIGLTKKGQVHARRYHPSERILGNYEYGDTVKVQVDPYRSYLFMATTGSTDEVGVTGADYEVVRDVEGKPVKLKLLGMPGQSATIQLKPGDRSFDHATLDGEDASQLLDGQMQVSFAGESLDKDWHRKLADLKRVATPADAEQLYETAAFTASNNAMEVQSRRRSGPTDIPQVKAAREAFFNQELFWRRGIWDRYVFDGKDKTFFSAPARRRLEGGAVRLDLGEVRDADRIRLKTLHEMDQGAPAKQMTAEVSRDLETWHSVTLTRDGKASPKKVKVARIEGDGARHHLFETNLRTWQGSIDAANGFRYLRFSPAPRRTAEIDLWAGEKNLDLADAHATFLFAPFDKVDVKATWSAKVTIDETPAPNSYLSLAVNGEHGRNGVIAALRVGDQWVGANHRAPSFPAVPFERGPARRGKNNTFYFPITDKMKGQDIDVVLLGLTEASKTLSPKVWTTVYPNPFVERELTLQ
jgi:hypothetical protein